MPSRAKSALFFNIVKKGDWRYIAQNMALTCRQHTSYLSTRSPIYRWRKISHVEKISDFNTWQMWRNFKFLHMQRNFSFFHTIDAEKCEFLPNLEEFHISPHDMCEEIKNLPCFVVVKSVLWRITLFLRNPFWRDLRAFAWRKIEPKIG